MLAVMTYNGYISIAIVIGSGLGYYTFGLILLEVKMAEFRKQHKTIQCNPECAGKLCKFTDNYFCFKVDTNYNYHYISINFFRCANQH